MSGGIADEFDRLLERVRQEECHRLIYGSYGTLQVSVPNWGLSTSSSWGEHQIQMDRLAEQIRNAQMQMAEQRIYVDPMNANYRYFYDGQNWSRNDPEPRPNPEGAAWMTKAIEGVRQAYDS